MLQLDVISGRQAGHSVVAKTFPFQIGRDAQADLPLDDAGVWDAHLEVQLRHQHFVLVLAPGTSMLANGEAAGPTPYLLHNGDVITLGAAQIRISLGASSQKSLAPRELITWSLLVLTVLGQIALIGWLLLNA